LRPDAHGGAAGLYQLPDGRWAERKPRECPRCHTRWFLPGDGPTRVLVGSHKCGCPAVRDGGGVHRTYLCLTCQLKVYVPPLDEEACVLGIVRMMAPTIG
jgi:ribosomal protein S27AE